MRVPYAYGRYGNRKCTTAVSSTSASDAYIATRQGPCAAFTIAKSLTKIVSHAPSPVSSRVAPLYRLDHEHRGPVPQNTNGTSIFERCLYAGKASGNSRSMSRSSRRAPKIMYGIITTHHTIPIG